MSQGYITLATGKKEYFDIAENLAMSVKYFDPNRAISLICDNKENISRRGKQLFDKIISIEHSDTIKGPANKIRVYHYSPYSETMFIDSDCLILKSDMNRHWKKHAKSDFGIAAAKVSSGSWYNFQVEDICKKLEIEYIAVMNSGLFYFRKGDFAERFFKYMMQLYENPKNPLAVDHRGLGIADEPFIGAAMGYFRVEPVSYSPEEGTSMITSYQSRRWQVDLASEYCTVEKSKGFLLLNRFFSKGWVKHSPSVGHFIKLKPRKLYQRLVSEFEELTY